MPRDGAGHRQSGTQIEEQRQQLVYPILILIQKPAGYWRQILACRHPRLTGRGWRGRVTITKGNRSASIRRIEAITGNLTRPLPMTALYLPLICSTCYRAAGSIAMTDIRNDNFTFISKESRTTEP
jgi:hypothetical protein